MRVHELLWNFQHHAPWQDFALAVALDPLVGDCADFAGANAEQEVGSWIRDPWLLDGEL
jgi:hypothetical protein